LVLDHVGIKKLELSQCGLGNAGLSKLWTGLGGQASRLEVLDTSNNQGIVQPEIIRHTLGQLRALKVLKIAGNTRAHGDYPLFDQASIYCWNLEELDLSGIAVSSLAAVKPVDAEKLMGLSAQ
jgi:Ran GTPase-activating protein (RanGAP) involved in mRNA processing and transport